MNSLSQLAAVFAIAGGAGLLTFSRHFDPPLVSTANLIAANPEVMMSSATRDNRETAATAGGCGTAFVTLGPLTLAVPWTNSILKQLNTPPHTSTS